MPVSDTKKDKAVSRSYSGSDFTSGHVMPQFIKFFLPFLISFLLNSLYNTIDTIIIGHFVGSSGIVAVAMGGKMLNLFTIVGTAFATGGQIYISQLSGAKKSKEVRETIGSLFSSLFIISVVIAVILIVFSRILLTFLNTPEESMSERQTSVCLGA